MNLLSILCFLLVSFGVVSAQPCVNNGFFRPNSSYDTNRGLVVSSLAPNVKAQNGFYNASTGQGSDRVYATGMCIPGAEPELCSGFVQDAADGLIRSCPNQTEAFTWSGGGQTLCMVRYSNSSFSGSLEIDHSSWGCNGLDIKSNLTDFDRIWEELTLRMIVEASTGKDASVLPDNKYYAANIAALTVFQNIHALMHCTPDLSSGNCEACLRRCVGDFQKNCHVKQGGYVFRPSCIFRSDLYPFNGAFDNITLTVPPSPSPALLPQPPASLKVNATIMSHKGGKTISKGIVIAIVVPAVIVFLVMAALGFVVCRRRKSYQSLDHQSGIDITTTHSLQFDFKTIEAATDKFSESNKIGQGGFGEVFKGVLPDGTEVAVKRLSKTSRQGAREFKNEAVLVAKLQHRNLVRLLGFCLTGEEKILVYEFVPNKSLDYFLFDPLKQGLVGWTTRCNIIGGIARGILYLHQDSRLTIIHRDLKASNVLLDAVMNPKIADFGIARIFGMDQTQAETSRIVGTYGYMSPEYAMKGHFSAKSDVYSFGVLVLEIISGKKNKMEQRDGNVSNLVTYVWRLWRESSPLDLVDPAIGGSYDRNEAIRFIHIALLCVQDDPADRPTLASIILMLTSNTITLPVPRQPGFFLQGRHDQDFVAEGIESIQSTERSVPYTVNDVSITELAPR
ncbi:hypothetical protein AALP_AA7G060200 [Arabis alpina]|uniref:Uncharacterized protein n=1 Tax=Arabis alpina TaxID=50452 RepID=A0A087GG80_ARAAL|nr:hypothetical protein AALP_AA7G060200 [Arabis alpina]